MQSPVVDGSYNYELTGEIMILMSDKVTIDNPIGKFVIPTLTPVLGNGSLIESSIPKKSTQNIINRDNLGASSITVSNYIELKIPKHLFSIKEIVIVPNTRSSGDSGIVSCAPKATIIYDEFIKGCQFIIVGKDDPRIIGVIPQ